MSSLRKQALAAVVVLLNTDRPDDVGEFHRDRLNPFEAATLPRGNVRIAPISQPQETVGPAAGRNSGVVVRTLRFAVEYYVTGATTDELDEGLIWITSKLAGSRLGGLVHWCEEEATIWDESALESDFRKATVIFELRYQTGKANQETRA